MNDVMYCISEGEYSDYHVLCVCPSKEEAEKLLAKMQSYKPHWADPDEDYWEHSGAQVETLPVADSSVEKVDILTMSVTLWDDGREGDIQTSHEVDWPFDALYGAPRVKWRWVRAPYHKGAGGDLRVMGVDHEAVRHVFSDRRAMLMTDDAMRARQEMNG